MSDNYLQALQVLLKNEGGYSNVKGDDGLETYEGISRKYYPNWRGWELIDQKKPLKQGEVIDDQALQGQVGLFYKNSFWLPLMLNRVISSDIATKTLDMAVNLGTYRAIKILQDTLNSMGNTLTEDGKMGQITLDKINSSDSNTLHTKLLEAQVNFYKDIVDRKPDQEKFLHGWISRANST